jgi:hypothetical protein
MSKGHGQRLQSLQVLFHESIAVGQVLVLTTFRQSYARAAISNERINGIAVAIRTGMHQRGNQLAIEFANAASPQPNLLFLRICFLVSNLG